MTVRLSLRLKLALLMSGVIAFISFTVFTYQSARMREDALTAAREEGLRIAELTAYTVSPALLFEDRSSAREALTATCRSEIVAAVEVFDGAGGSFARCAGQGSDKAGTVVSTAPVISESRKIGTLRLSLSLAHVAERVASGREWLIGITLLIFGVGMGAAVGISLLITRPLRSITATAEAVRAGDMTRRTSALTNDEVGTLGKTFNLMLDELERLNRGLEQTVESRTREVTTLLQSTYDGIIAAGSDGRCVMVNRSAAMALGMDAGMGIGRDLHELLHGPGEPPGCSLPAVLHAGDRRQVREIFRKADGSTMTVDVSVAPMRDNQRTTGMVMTFRDVSELDKLQSELDHARRLTSLGTLAANMAHEFNNVLMGILPFVDMIRRVTSTDTRIQEWCRTIMQSVNRGKRVTKEVLEFTRPKRPNMRPLAVASWLKEFEPVLRATAGSRIEVEIRVEPDLQISADREQAEQLLVNLVANSRDAMPAGGAVEISVIREQFFARITVRDNGPGMSSETRRRIFEPFFTTKQVGGTGLGVPIAEQIVKGHGGTIELESALDEGTAFHIRLPLAPSQGSEGPVRGLAPEKFTGRVLLVEDDLAVAAGLQALLEDHGAVVVHAATGSAALELLRAGVPDVVVLDVGLPDIDGIVLYARVAAAYPDLPVVFSTGHGDESQMQEILKRPNVRFLLKPYSAETLIRALAESAMTARC